VNSCSFIFQPRITLTLAHSNVEVSRPAWLEFPPLLSLTVCSHGEGRAAPPMCRPLYPPARPTRQHGTVQKGAEGEGARQAVQAVQGRAGGGRRGVTVTRRRGGRRRPGGGGGAGRWRRPRCGRRRFPPTPPRAGTAPGAATGPRRSGRRVAGSNPFLAGGKKIVELRGCRIVSYDLLACRGLRGRMSGWGSRAGAGPWE